MLGKRIRERTKRLDGAIRQNDAQLIAQIESEQKRDETRLDEIYATIGVPVKFTAILDEVARMDEVTRDYVLRRPARRTKRTRYIQ